jgi:hypothetical protein
MTHIHTFTDLSHVQRVTDNPAFCDQCRDPATEKTTMTGQQGSLIFEMCGHSGCSHFITANPAAGPGLAAFDHLDDGDKEHDHDAVPGGGTGTLATWRTTRPDLFVMYADGRIGPNSTLSPAVADEAWPPGKTFIQLTRAQRLAAIRRAAAALDIQSETPAGNRKGEPS